MEIYRGIGPTILDPRKVRIWGFSDEGVKSRWKIDGMRKAIRDGVPLTPAWVGEIGRGEYQLLNSTDIPHLPPRNLAGHHRSIAYYEEGVPQPVIIMTCLPRRTIEADTLIQHILVQ